MENVAALRRRGLDRVLGDLAESGYHAVWTSVRASDVGAPHQRERLFILGYQPEALPRLAAAADADRQRRSRTPRLAEGTAAGLAVRRRRPHSHALPNTRVATPSDSRWGQYGPAIRRWEAVLGRPAPYPIERGTKGQPRIDPAFSEWLMGLPAGFVTNLELPYGAQLKALGNGVVPLQATAALRQLLYQVVEANEPPGPTTKRSNS